MYHFNRYRYINSLNFSPKFYLFSFSLILLNSFFMSILYRFSIMQKIIVRILYPCLQILNFCSGNSLLEFNRLLLSINSPQINYELQNLYTLTFTVLQFFFQFIFPTYKYFILKISLFYDGENRLHVLTVRDVRCNVTHISNNMQITLN